MDQKSQHLEHERGSWGSNFGFLMAAVGSAVGLGNIWGFPYKMGMTGGFAFLIVYLILVVVVGHKWVGFLGVVAGFCLLAFYNVLGGMVMRYMFGFFFELVGLDGFAGQGTAFFGFLLYDYGGMLFFHVLFVIINILIVMGGVESGIEKFSSVAMPALFFILLFVVVYIAFQDGAAEGYAFMFKPDFSAMSSFSGFINVLKTAAGQMFFSLSLGMGCMITYGSYLDKKEDLQKNAIIIPACDTLIAVMAGMAVLPACAAYDVPYASGPGLLFTSMQQVFTNMGEFGAFVGFMFYFLVFSCDEFHLPARGRLHLSYRPCHRQGCQAEPSEDHLHRCGPHLRRRPAGRSGRSGQRRRDRPGSVRDYRLSGGRGIQGSDGHRLLARLL